MKQEATTARRTRRDPRRQATRAALIDAAESLFAEFGVDAVSALQIGVAIGAANTNVVAYHFGGKDALIEQIYRARLPVLEARTAQLLQELEARGEPDSLAALIRALWLPLYELTNAAGKHAFAAFTAGHLRSRDAWLLLALSPEYPVSFQAAERMRALVPESARPLALHRLGLVYSMVANALRLIDQQEEGVGETAELLFDDVIAMAAAAMGANAEPAANPL